MKKGYNIFELNNLEFLTRMLRACPQISFEIANNLNRSNTSIALAIKNYQDEASLIDERSKSSGGDDSQIKEDVKLLNTKKYEIEVIELSGEHFKDIQGEREYFIGQTPAKFPYREAYFGLLDEIIIQN